jgi:hypothetical protein
LLVAKQLVDHACIRISELGISGRHGLSGVAIEVANALDQLR